MRHLPIALLLLAGCDGDKVAEDSPRESDVPFAPPTLSMEPEAVDLGELDAPDRAQEVVVLSNDGPGEIEILALSFAGDSDALSVSPSEPLPLVLPARSTLGVTVACLASLPMTVEDQLVITTGWTSDAGEPQRQLYEVALRCQTHGPELIVVDDDQDLGPVAVPCQAEGVIGLQNIGDRASRVTGTPISENEPIFLDVASVGALPWRIEPGELLEIPATFTPTEAGEAIVMITINQEVGPTLNAVVRGEGFLDERVTDRFTAEAEQQRFALSATPVRSTLEVDLNGAPQTSGWSYDSSDDAVVFTSAPGESAALEIRYHPEAPCGG